VLIRPRTRPVSRTLVMYCVTYCVTYPGHVLRHVLRHVPASRTCVTYLPYFLRHVPFLSIFTPCTCTVLSRLIRHSREAEQGCLGRFEHGRRDGFIACEHGRRDGCIACEHGRRDGFIIIACEHCKQRRVLGGEYMRLREN
jgi:hypothetical protein